LVFSHGQKPVYTAPDTVLQSGDGGEAGLGGEVLEQVAPPGYKGQSGIEFEVP
jgi:hypothetical protein